ncbi:uncharacterized protein LOC105183769 [Harpegnathos saltator]|uniref:Uncharacterized protein n=1 Tax=Harpegnathos saltator TaxID=610380 RepID=E2BK99_HARSA|nr:uncharacterized protein LOC105183769 [Harpegnathos saltator]EFN83896.1 hypothetical protein EAI_00450 [Harpegnathos saltator]
MRTESLAVMENRLSDTSAPCHNLPRKSKRRSSRRSNATDAWNCGQQNNQDGGLMSGVEYHHPRMLWSSNMPQNVQGSGQRLFTAMSDPSVCGYSAMPVTYTMQPVSLPPMYSLYQPVPLPNVRTVHHGTSRPVRSERSAKICHKVSNSSANGCGNAQENGLESTVHIAHQNGDYASLPPTADSGVNGDELNSEHRRYSDPGLGPAKVSSHPDSDDSGESESSVITIGHTNKLALSLMEQITDLKKYNSQLFKELSVTKSYFESMKAELVQYKHCASSDYQPGMLSEFIREIREANKKYEEGLIAKVTSLLEERYSQQAKEIEALKNQLSKVTDEYEESKKRIATLEEELTALKLSATNGGREIAAFEEETLALRRELQEARASRTLAENHAAKCVNLAVPRSVTPVTYESSDITSTPVRTALSDTRCLSPVPDTLTADTTSTPISTSVATSVFRSSCSAEVASPLVIETTLTRNRTDSGVVVSSDSSPEPQTMAMKTDKLDQTPEAISASCQPVLGSANDETAARCNTENPGVTRADPVTNLVYSARLANLLYYGLLDTKAIYEMYCERNPLVGEEKKTTTNVAQADDDLFTEIFAESTEVDLPAASRNGHEAGIAPLNSLEEQNGSSKKSSGDTASKAEGSSTEGSPSSLESFSATLFGLKKRRKKSHSKRSSNESDKLGKIRQRDAVLGDRIMSSCSNAKHSCDRMNGNRFVVDDSRASRAIVDVPDVAVVDGGSFVPKDLCSTRILTSRVLTAPSRATYTTAYI